MFKRSKMKKSGRRGRHGNKEARGVVEDEKEVRKKEEEVIRKGGRQEKLMEGEKENGSFAQQLQAPTESATHEREHRSCMAAWVLAGRPAGLM